MLTEFRIVGGCLKMPKSMFIREMLGKVSKLKGLLNWKSVADSPLRHPMIKEPEEGWIFIDFSNSAYVSIGDSPREVLDILKARYGEKLGGRIYCRAALYTFVLDLDLFPDKVEFILE
jgi:hypothetical protein